MNTLVIVIIVVIVIGLIVVDRIVENKSHAKYLKRSMEEKAISENKKLQPIIELLFEYGKQCGKIGEILYDIEEGGHYYKELREEDVRRLKELISENISIYRQELLNGPNREKVIKHIKQQIDKLENGTDGSVGFHDYDY